MSYPGWMIAKWQRERAENALPWKQMKDRNMEGCELKFKTENIQGNNYYYLKEIVDSTGKITYDYVANLGGKKKRAPAEWSHHGYGGYVKYVTLDEQEFNRMKGEVERLKGRVTITK